MATLGLKVWGSRVFWRLFWGLGGLKSPLKTNRGRSVGSGVMALGFRGSGSGV